MVKIIGPMRRFRFASEDSQQQRRKVCSTALALRKREGCMHCVPCNQQAAAMLIMIIRLAAEFVVVTETEPWQDDAICR